MCEGNFVDGLLSGFGTVYYLTGNIMYQGEFINGKALGIGILNFENGTIEYEGKEINVLRGTVLNTLYNERKSKKSFAVDNQLLKKFLK